jgi:hypothetical protein
MHGMEHIKHDTNFFYIRIQALAWWWDRFLNVTGNYAEVTCVPSATHVSCINQNRNKGLSTCVCYLIFWSAFVLTAFNVISTCPSTHIKNQSHQYLLKWTKETAVSCALLCVSYRLTKTTEICTLDVTVLNTIWYLHKARWMGNC